MLAGRVATIDGSPVQVSVIYAGVELGAMQATGDYSLTVPQRSGLYRLEIRHPSGASRVWDIVDAAAGPHALPGAQGQLFLAGDSNDSRGQFTQPGTLSDSSQMAWRKTFDSLPVWSAAFGLERSGLLIAPAKEENYRDHYPQPRARHTILDDFLHHFADRGVIFPKWPLWNRRELAWSRTDTHWTDFGATVAAAEVLSAWGNETNGLPDQFRVVQRIGDLGSKLDPMVSSHEMTFPQQIAERQVFDNGVPNQGNIRVLDNPCAAHRGTLLIFGDSFGTNLAQAFSGVFSRVVYAYRPAGFDSALTEVMTPTHLLLQITQRFLHGQPITTGSIFETAAVKISALPDTARKDVINRLRDHADGPFAALANRHLDRL